MRQKFRSALKLFSINIGVLLIGAVIIELIFGGWFSENRGILVIPKDFSRRFDVGDLYHRDDPIIQYRRDSYGLRGDYGSPSSIKVLAIGGSTTNEVFISEGETWIDVLASRFPTQSQPVPMANAGVDGQSTIGMAKNFELWFPTIPKLSPEYVIAYIGINELAVIESGYLQKQDHLVAKRRVFKQFLLNNSALYTLFRNLRGMIIARRANLVHQQGSYDNKQWIIPSREPDISAYKAAHMDELAAYKDTVRHLATAIRDFGAEPVFVTQQRGNYRIKNGQVLVQTGPKGEDDLQSYIGLAAVNEATLDVCNEVGAICVDLAAKINFTDGDHYDGLHTTPQGSAKIGNLLYEELKYVLEF